jgi:hypothetical protein
LAQVKSEKSGAIDNALAELDNPNWNMMCDPGYFAQVNEVKHKNRLAEVKESKASRLKPSVELSQKKLAELKGKLNKE